LCSIEFGPGTIGQVYNETIFNLDATPKDSCFYQVSVSGKLKIDPNILVLPSGFGPNPDFFCFHLETITVHQPVQLPFQAGLFLFVIMWFPIVIIVSCFFAFWFFMSRL
jgi:hypothetical protein